MNTNTYDICRMTFLYVDDDADIVNMMQYFISRNYVNQKLVCAENGLDALVKCRNYQPDLFLVDLSMPLMGGVMFIEEVISRNKEAEIMVISVNKDQDMVQRCLDLGAKHYLLKPVAFEDLFEKMDGMMERIFWKRLCAAKGINYGCLL